MNRQIERLKKEYAGKMNPVLIDRIIDKIETQSINTPTLYLQRIGDGIIRSSNNTVDFEKIH